VAQAVSRPPVTTEARVLARVIPFGTCGGRVALGKVFLGVLSLPCQYHSTGLLIHVSSGVEKQACWWPQFRDIVHTVGTNMNMAKSDA
jgi:hypothetical protein